MDRQDQKGRAMVFLLASGFVLIKLFVVFGIKNMIKQNKVWKHFEDTPNNKANKHEAHATKNLVLNIFDLELKRKL